jgi:hypothetical protein
MSMRTIQSMGIACLFAGGIWAADDPFVGTWKLNQEKSKIAGEQMKIEDLGNNKYKISFGQISDTITADGTDQPVHFGRTRSITKEGANTWKVVTKNDGKVINSVTETVSENGNTLTMKGKNTKPDGSTSDYEVATKRVGSGSGFAGTWEAQTSK